jgi:hypothetical protein
MASVNKTIDGGFSNIIQTRAPFESVEGIWNPVMTSPGGTLNFDTSIVSGYYQKVGNLVHISFAFSGNSFNSNGESGNLQVGGLPFPIGSVGAGPPSLGVAYSTTDNIDSCAAWANGSVLNLIHNHNFVNVGVVGNGSNFTIYGSCSYWVATI